MTTNTQSAFARRARPRYGEWYVYYRFSAHWFMYVCVCCDVCVGVQTWMGQRRRVPTFATQPTGRWASNYRYNSTTSEWWLVWTHGTRGWVCLFVCVRLLPAQVGAFYYQCVCACVCMSDGGLCRAASTNADRQRRRSGHGKIRFSTEVHHRALSQS